MPTIVFSASPGVYDLWLAEYMSALLAPKPPKNQNDLGAVGIVEGVARSLIIIAMGVLEIL
jgi:hypothetical protein